MISSRVSNLILQHENVEAVGNLSKWSSEICSLCWPDIEFCEISAGEKEFHGWWPSCKSRGWNRLLISFFTSCDKFPYTFSHWFFACSTLIQRVKHSLITCRGGVDYCIWTVFFFYWQMKGVRSQRGKKKASQYQYTSTESFQVNAFCQWHQQVEDICKLGPLELYPHAHRAMERRCQDEMQKHKLAGHAVDPDAFIQEGVLCFDHHAAGQRTILVSRFSSHASINFSGKCLQPHRRARHTIGTPIQIRPDQPIVGFPVLCGALKTPPRAVKILLWRAGRFGRHAAGQRATSSENAHVHELLWRPSFQVICVHVHIIGIRTKLTRNCLLLDRFPIDAACRGCLKR